MTVTKPWTVLIWSASDNQLYNLLQKDLKEAEQVGTNDTVNLVCQTSHQPMGGHVERLELQQNTALQVEDLGPDVSMSRPDTLADFITWGVEKYPAEHYMLVIAGNGSGWKGACYSATPPEGEWLNLPQLEEGLKAAQERTGQKLSVLGFDAGIMAQVEVAHQLAPYADYLVGSPDAEKGNGWQYDEVLQNLGTPQEVARGIVDMARNHPKDLPAMTSLDTSQVAALSAAMKGFSQAIVTSRAQLDDLANHSQSYYKGKDVEHFAEGVRQTYLATDLHLAMAADKVARAAHGVVDAEFHSNVRPHAHGLGVEMSTDDLRLHYTPYRDTSFARDTGWEAAIHKIRDTEQSSRVVAAK